MTACQRRVLATTSVVLLAVLVLSGCRDGDAPGDRAAPKRTAPVDAVAARIDAIGQQVDAWQRAESLQSAIEHARRARALIEGPTGPDSTDSDFTDGLLPGTDDQHPGLAAALADTCAARTILGDPDWSHPEARWKHVADLVDEWSETNNRFPELPSHPQRIVGWASLTERAYSVEDAHEYAGHAQLHVTESKGALKCLKTEPTALPS